MSPDTERREVARRLRDWTWKSGPPECLLNQLVFGDECPGTDDDPDTIGCDECEVMAAKRLADLIEPDIYPDNPDKTQQGLSGPCDRDALLALADNLDSSASMLLKQNDLDPNRKRRGMRRDHAQSLMAASGRIREALGE